MSQPQTAKVVTVLSARKWEKDGEVKQVYYDLKLEGVEKPINLGRGPQKEPLKPGDEVTFVLTGEEDHGKLKAKEPRPFGGGGGPRGKSPEERRSIARQHSQKAALTYAAIKGEKGDLPANFKVSDLKPIIDWLFNDVLAAEKS